MKMRKAELSALILKVSLLRFALKCNCGSLNIRLHAPLPYLSIPFLRKQSSSEVNLTLTVDALTRFPPTSFITPVRHSGRAL